MHEQSPSSPLFLRPSLSSLPLLELLSRLRLSPVPVFVRVLVRTRTVLYLRTRSEVRVLRTSREVLAVMVRVQYSVINKYEYSSYRRRPHMSLAAAGQVIE